MGFALSLRMRSKTWVLALAVALAIAPLALAEEMPVNSEQQCSMFKRIFTYDKHLRDSDKVIVIIVGASPDAPDVAAVADAFRSTGMFPATVTVDSLNNDLSATLSPQSTVVYVMPDVDYDTVNAFAAAHGFLSVSGLPSLAESGRVSVSVDIAAGRPEVIVNMPRLTTEGHELSSELLKLARVIR